MHVLSANMDIESRAERTIGKVLALRNSRLNVEQQNIETFQVKVELETRRFNDQRNKPIKANKIGKSDDKLDPNESQSISDQNPEQLENYQIFHKSIHFFSYFGDPLGIYIRYDWKPNICFGFALFQLSVIISQITYTQYLHVKNHAYFRLLETLACYGITISVYTLRYNLN